MKSNTRNNWQNWPTIKTAISYDCITVEHIFHLSSNQTQHLRCDPKEYCYSEKIRVSLWTVLRNWMEACVAESKKSFLRVISWSDLLWNVNAHFSLLGLPRKMGQWNIRGYQWLSMDIHASPCMSIDILRFPWTSIDFFGFPTIQIHIHVYPWISRDIHRTQWISIGINWDDLSEIHGY